MKVGDVFKKGRTKERFVLAQVSRTRVNLISLKDFTAANPYANRVESFEKIQMEEIEFIKGFKKVGTVTGLEILES